MPIRLRPVRSLKRSSALTIGVLLIVVTLPAALRHAASESNAIETAVVVRGEFSEALLLRGDVKATSSVLVVAPPAAGDLRIVGMARSGAAVQRDQIVVEFDKTEVTERLNEKQTALRVAEAEIEQARARDKIDYEATKTEQVKGQYDVQRAMLGVAVRDVVSAHEAAKAELDLSDAEVRALEISVRLDSTRMAHRAEMRRLVHTRDKAADDVALAIRQLAALTLHAPASGLFVVQTTTRAGSLESEYREGDNAFSGAVIAEIPNPSKVYLATRVDEADRGRLEIGSPVVVTPDALPGVEIPAKVAAVGALARPDSRAPWPHPYFFDVSIELNSEDSRLQPGMSAVAVVATERLTNTLLVPRRAVIVRNGTAVVHVADSRGFTRSAVRVARWGSELVAIDSGVAPGQRVVLGAPAREQRTNSRTLLSFLGNGRTSR
jgi:HlyD family secretion protein